MPKTNTSIFVDSSAISVAFVAIQSIDPNGNSIKYFQRLLQCFGVVYMAIVIILGFIGNSISCYVFVRSKLKYEENINKKYIFKLIPLFVDVWVVVYI